MPLRTTIRMHLIPATCTLALILAAQACGSSDKGKSDAPKPEDGGSGDTPAGNGSDASTGTGPSDTGSSTPQAPSVGSGSTSTGTGSGSGGGTGAGSGAAGSGSGTAVAGKVPPELIGVWRSKCIPLLDGNNQRSIITESGFTADGAFTGKFREFFDGACADANRTTTITGVAIQGEPVAAPAGATALDYVIAMIQLTPESAGARLSLKNSAFCGTEAWTVGVAQDVTGKECKKPQGNGEVTIRFNAKNERIQDVYKLDAAVLLLGVQFNESGTGLVPARPTSFNDVSYAKVP